MRVIMMLKSDAPSEAGIPPDERMLTEMGQYSERLINAGLMLGGEGLHPTSMGAKVRISKGKTHVIDGPFAEAKEVVAGYYLLKTKDLQEAIEWTKQLPGADYIPEGEAELRPLYEPEDFAPRGQPIGQPPPAFAVPGPEKGLRWMHLLRADENTERGMQPSPKLLQEMGALMAEMAEKGILISGDGLRPSSQGARVHLKNKKITVVDGPFTESKELVAGITMFRARTKAEAIEWARRCLQIHMDGTGIDTGEIEVRQVYETDEVPETAEEKAGTSTWREQEKKQRERLSR
jgi:hypothetical protein